MIINERVDVYIYIYIYLYKHIHFLLNTGDVKQPTGCWEIPLRVCEGSDLHPEKDAPTSGYIAGRYALSR